MRTLLLSDLHLGCGVCPGIFVGGAVLEVLLRHLGPEPLRVVLNGDTFDFPSQLHEDSGAVSVMRAFVEDAAVARVLARLGALVVGGGELVLRAGEDDRELGDPRVQEALVGGLCTSGAAAAARVAIAAGGAPMTLEIGGVRVLVTRLARGGDAARALARRLLNPLRLHFGVGLVDLLRPDYAGAVLAMLAVNPTAAKQVFRQFGPGAPCRPERDEAAELPLRRLARRRRAAAVVVGGSHVAGWHTDRDVTVADAGSWTLSVDMSGLTSLTSPEVWRRTMREWQRVHRLDRLDPALAARLGVRSRVHALLLEPAAGGARLTLLECGATQAPGVVRARLLPASP